jgi:hypothetical protein
MAKGGAHAARARHTTPEASPAGPLQAGSHDGRLVSIAIDHTSKCPDSSLHARRCCLASDSIRHPWVLHDDVNRWIPVARHVNAGIKAASIIDTAEDLWIQGHLCSPHKNRGSQQGRRVETTRRDSENRCSCPNRAQRDQASDESLIPSDSTPGFRTRNRNFP